MLHTLMAVILRLACGVLNSSHPNWNTVKVWNEKHQVCFGQGRNLKPNFLCVKSVTQPSGFGSHRSCPWANQPWKKEWEESSSSVLITATGSKLTFDFMIPDYNLGSSRAVPRQASSVECLGQLSAFSSPILTDMGSSRGYSCLTACSMHDFQLGLPRWNQGGFGFIVKAGCPTNWISVVQELFQYFGNLPFFKYSVNTGIIPVILEHLVLEKYRH